MLLTFATRELFPDRWATEIQTTHQSKTKSTFFNIHPANLRLALEDAVLLDARASFT